MKHRILIQTNPPWIKTGLSEAGKTLMKYLYATNKYELAYYCTQTSIGDPNLNTTPWKSYGCLPTDPRAIQELNQDPGKARDAAYGAWNIDNVIKDFKPTIIIGSDDAWGFSKSNYIDKPWWKAINSVLHITLDSLPILEQAFEQAAHTKYYFTWAKFAAKAMRSVGPQFGHVKQIYGAMDTKVFAPISDIEKAEWRKRFNIVPGTVIFNFVFRNQLRKSANLILDGFARFKRENPQANVKLHFHTSWSEMGNGWNFPKMMGYYGIKNEDVLCTYVCKNCGQWHVAPYGGEDIDCPYCGAKKSMITASIVHGIPPMEMKYLYGISDAALCVMTSGGQELTASQSLLCSKPLACTNYSCGEDFCEQDFVFPLSYQPYHEQGTNFIKAATDVDDIKKYMLKVWRMNPKDLKAWGERGREWAIKTFSIEAIGAQWESLFDSMPTPDWTKIDLTPKPKNDQFPFPVIEDENRFITTLYTEILKMNEPENGEGFKHWKARLKDGMKREDIYAYFISVAQSDNAKSKPENQDFWNMLDKTTGRKRALLVIKESIGDIILVTSLFKSFHEQHPNTDLYVATDPKFHEILIGNPHVYRILPYLPAMEQEMVMTGSGQNEGYFDSYYHVCIQTQRILSYLTQPSPAFDMRDGATLKLGQLGQLGGPLYV